MIEVENKKVPHSFRNKYLRNSGSVSISTTTPTPINGSGANLDVLKIDDGRTVSDENVFSSLRSLFEIKSRIIALTDNNTAPTDDNTFSSLLHKAGTRCGYRRFKRLVSIQNSAR